MLAEHAVVSFARLEMSDQIEMTSSQVAVPILFLLRLYSLYRLRRRVARGNFLQLLCYLLVDLGLNDRSRLLFRRELLCSHSPPQRHDLQTRQRGIVTLLVTEKHI